MQRIGPIFLLAFLTIACTSNYPNVECLFKKYVNDGTCLMTLNVEEMCREAEEKSKLSFEDARIAGERVWDMLCEDQDRTSVHKALECTQDESNEEAVVQKCGDVDLESTDCSAFAETFGCEVREWSMLCGNARVATFLTEAYINNDDHKKIFRCRHEIAQAAGFKIW
ncbi:unnamed protein product, partial [Mesorhabditis belari]|uniref:Uncharacterized protein n=1 Tax=Mesorhabditis belari TaxID=2138241 RepID=A0AAF3J8H6_9BILA